MNNMSNMNMQRSGTQYNKGQMQNQNAMAQKSPRSFGTQSINAHGAIPYDQQSMGTLGMG